MRILYLPNEYSQQRQYEKKRKIYPVLMAMEAEWYRKQGHHVFWGSVCLDDYKWDKIITKPEGLPFLSLPHPDRELTRWWEYQDNGNFKHLPATYIQSASGCWWGKCSFCVEKGKPYEVRPVEDVISEIEECKQLGFKEVFDDSATFPTGEWLERFCNSIHSVGIRWGCNTRISGYDFNLMARSGCRMVLFGIESASQYTLDRINKGVKVEDIKYIIKASKAGLEPHTAAMVGFPWESDEDAFRTIKLVKWLLSRGYTKTAQISFYTPPLPQPRGNEKQRKFVNKIYDVAYNPLFWYYKLKDIKTIDDIRYLLRGIREGINAKTHGNG